MEEIQAVILFCTGVTHFNGESPRNVCFDPHFRNFAEKVLSFLPAVWISGDPFIPAGCLFVWGSGQKASGDADVALSCFLGQDNAAFKCNRKVGVEDGLLTVSQYLCQYLGSN